MAKSKTIDVSNGGGGNSTVTIKHKVQGRSAGSAARSALFFGMKPAVAILGIYAIVATAAWGFLLPWGLSLSSEVDRLTEQVDRLSGEVDELETQVDRYEEQNEILARNNEEFAKQNGIFDSNNDEFEGQNDRLNVSVAELIAQNNILNASVTEYARLNAELESSNKDLEDEVSELESIANNLTATAVSYEETAEALSAELAILQNTNAELENEVEDLDGQVSSLSGENDRLEKLIKDLGEIEQFIEQEANNIEQTVEQLASFLAEQIEDNQQLLLTRLETTYQQSRTGWACGYDITYRGFPFTSDPNSPLGATYYSAAVASTGNNEGYVQGNVLSRLCLDATDFELYLANYIDSAAVPPVDVTTNQLQSGVWRYVQFAMDWYFPGVDATAGLSIEDWNDAGFDCENLPREKQFFWALKP